MNDSQDTAPQSDAEAKEETTSVSKLGLGGALHVVRVSVKGKSHMQNEDAIDVNDKKLLFCIADGISQSEGGTDAARSASQIAAKYLTCQPDVLNDETALEQFAQANEIVREKTNKGGGASAVALRMSGKWASIYHVGDCRAYIIRCDSWWENPKVRVITNDHLILAEEGQPRGLGQALGHWIFEVGRHHVQLRHGDSVVLCSDGIYKSKNVEQFFLSLVELSERELLKAMKLYATKCALAEDDDASIVHIRYRGILGVRAMTWWAFFATIFFAFSINGGHI